jgi:hypothetical protein
MRVAGSYLVFLLEGGPFADDRTPQVVPPRTTRVKPNPHSQTHAVVVALALPAGRIRFGWLLACRMGALPARWSGKMAADLN